MRAAPPSIMRCRASGAAGPPAATRATRGGPHGGRAHRSARRAAACREHLAVRATATLEELHALTIVVAMALAVLRVGAVWAGAVLGRPAGAVIVVLATTVRGATLRDQEETVFAAAIFARLEVALSIVAALFSAKSGLGAVRACAGFGNGRVGRAKAVGEVSMARGRAPGACRHKRGRAHIACRRRFLRATRGNDPPRKSDQGKHA